MLVSHGRQWLPPDDAQGIVGCLAFATTRLDALAEARRVAVVGAGANPNTLNGRGRVGMRQLEDTLTEQRKPYRRAVGLNSTK